MKFITNLIKSQRVLGLFSLVAIPISLFMAFVYAPEEATMGVVQRIFYYHVASAWVSFLLFFIVCLASIAYLRKRQVELNQLAVSAAELGVMFTTLTLITGPLWARSIWGAWWTWDPRLTTTLVLWFIYIAYLMIQSGSEGQERQLRFAAVFGIIGFADIPLIFISTRMWRSIHPNVIEGGKMNMPPEMVFALVTSVFTFTFLALFLLSQRLQLALMLDRVLHLKEKHRQQLGG